MTSGPPQRTVRWTERLPVPGLILAAALGLLGIVIWTAQLTTQSLWYDEGSSIYLSGAGPGGGPIQRVLAAPGSDSLQPVHPLLLAGWRGLFGSSEASLRMSSVVLGVGLLVLIWWAANDLFDPRHALWSLAMAACASILVQYSQEVRPYALEALIGTAEVVAYLRLLRADPSDARRRFVFGALVVVGLVTSLLLCVLAAALVATDLLIRRDRRVVQTWWTVGIGLLVVGSYAVAIVLTRPLGQEVSALKGPIVLNVAYALYGLVAGPSFGPPPEAIRASGLQAFDGWWPWLAVLLVTCVVAALTALVGVLRTPTGTDRRQAGVALVLIIVAGMGGAVAFALVSRLNLQPRHVIYLVGPICLLVPFAVVGIAPDRETTNASGRDSRTADRARTAVGVAALLGLMVLNLTSVGHYLFDPAYWRDDYRAAAAYLRAHSAEGPSVLLWGRDDLLAYYGSTSTVDLTSLPVDKRGNGIRQSVGTPSRIFVAINRPYYFADDPEGTVQAGLGSTYHLEGSQTFQNLIILEYARSQGRSNGGADPV